MLSLVRRGALGLLVALVGTVAACGGTSGSSITDAPPGAGTGDAGALAADGASVDPDGSAVGVSDGGPGVATRGCGTSAPAGMQSKTTKVGGVERRYQLFVPTGYDASRPLPLAFVFHGRGGDGNQIRAYLSMEKESAGQALFVYPDGLPQSSQGGATGWALDDVKFFDTMVAEVSESHCVDAKRIFAAGHSFGAYMSNLVGCERGDVVRAIAPVSGGVVPGTCKGPVAAWISHGDKDNTVDQREGVAARDRWTKLNGCATTTKPTGPDTCIAYDGCSAGHPVTWCSFSGGHFPLPAYTRQAIWDFFKAF